MPENRTLEEMIEYYERAYNQSLKDLEVNKDDGGVVYNHIVDRMNRYRQTADWLRELKVLIDRDVRRKQAFDEFVDNYVECLKNK